MRDVEHLEELIDRFAVYGQTTTSIVQSSPVPRRGVPLENGYVACESSHSARLVKPTITASIQYCERTASWASS